MQLTIVISAEVSDELEAALITANIKGAVDSYKTNKLTVNSQTTKADAVYVVK